MSDCESEGETEEDRPVERTQAMDQGDTQWLIARAHKFTALPHPDETWTIHDDEVPDEIVDEMKVLNSHNAIISVGKESRNERHFDHSVTIWETNQAAYETIEQYQRTHSGSESALPCDCTATAIRHLDHGIQCKICEQVFDREDIDDV